MASFLGKVLRNRSQPATRFITLLNKSQTQIPSAPPPTTIGSETAQNPIFLIPKREDSNTNASSLFHPTFSFDYFLNPVPILRSGFIFQSEDAGVASRRESPEIWADSVKKKRKKKMNKHKLKKLRKRLRKKT
ncbi:hypothetical protein DM860_005185 [Cuscuta australis]|uniref:Small ribosomal subunit protein mS38 n=1 Tax=Cuscuta australis TaxID=267555 RepID=A0A328DN57_9ASTE|nr:hypothetical protein DM860_005185 [Cuscuta australis]